MQQLPGVAEWFEAGAGGAVRSEPDGVVVGFQGGDRNDVPGEALSGRAGQLGRIQSHPWLGKPRRRMGHPSGIAETESQTAISSRAIVEDDESDDEVDLGGGEGAADGVAGVDAIHVGGGGEFRSSTHLDAEDAAAVVDEEIVGRAFAVGTRDDQAIPKGRGPRNTPRPTRPRACEDNEVFSFCGGRFRRVGWKKKKGRFAADPIIHYNKFGWVECTFLK